MIHSNFKRINKRYNRIRLARGGSATYSPIDTSNINTNFGWENVIEGGVSGAAAGTAIEPGIGTAVGAVVGAGAGAITSAFQQKAARNELADANYYNEGVKLNNDQYRLGDYNQSISTPYSYYNKGGKININPKNKGNFTKYAKANGMSVQGAANKILRNKNKYSSRLVKRANFARNAANWHKANGGDVETKQVGEGVQVKGKNGKDTIPMSINGQQVMLDNNEIIVNDVNGKPVVLSDDLGTADKYRNRLLRGANPKVEALKLAEEAKRLNPNPNGKGRAWGGYGNNNGFLGYDYNKGFDVSSLPKPLEDYYNPYQKEYNKYVSANPNINLNIDSMPSYGINTIANQVSNPNMTVNNNYRHIPINNNLEYNKILPNSKGFLGYSNDEGFAINTPTLNKPVELFDYNNPGGYNYLSTGTDTVDTSNPNGNSQSNNFAKYGQAISLLGTTANSIIGAARLANTKYPRLTGSPYTPLNTRVNKPIFDSNRTDINRGSRNATSAVLNNTTNSNVALSRLNSVEANRLNNLARVGAQEQSDIGRLENANTQGINRNNMFNTQLANQYNNNKYRDSVGRINTDLALTNSTLAGLDKIVENARMGNYQTEQLQTLSNQYGLGLDMNINSVQDFVNAINAKLGKNLKTVTG